MLSTRLASVFAVIAVAGAAPRAQTVSAPKETITVDEAIDEALEHNLSLMAEKTNLTIAEAAMISARLRPNPVASVRADQLDLLGTDFNTTNNGGPPELAVRVDIPIERGSKREKRIELASFE